MLFRSLNGKVTVTADKRDELPNGSVTYTYTADSTTQQRDHPADNVHATLRLVYQGVPASLSPGEAFTITITGSISDTPKDVSIGVPFAGVIVTYGDIDVKSAQQTDRGNFQGKYELRVRPNAKSAEIHLGSAWGTVAIWKYGNAK